MAEFVEVMKQKERICEKFIFCTECFLFDSEDVNCMWNSDKPKETEEIIMKWAQEHPIQTNKDKFVEVFGKDLLKTLIVYPNRFDWNKQYKAPTEEVSE